MKKLIIFVLLSLLYVSNTYGYSCDQTFYGKLRYGKQYSFYDEFQNNGLNAKGISSINITYVEEYDYNGSSDFPSFPWTNRFKGKNYILESGDGGRVIESDDTYPILYHPENRRTSNFTLRYEAHYYEKVGGVWDLANEKVHTECKNYEITWCGDGIIDMDQGEECDGGTDCDSTCKKIVQLPISAGTCNAGVTGTQTSPISSSTANLCLNTGETVVNFLSTTSGNIVNYTWECSDGNVINTGNNCFANYTGIVRRSGGSVYQCRDITKVGNNIKCEGNSKVKTFKLTCSGNELITPAIITGNTTYANFTCSDENALCSVYDSVVTEVGGYAWRTSLSCNLEDGDSKDYCGDGIIQRPNDDGQMEECDYGNESIWPSFCSKTTCRYTDFTRPEGGLGEITIPNDGVITFGPTDSVIIGAGMNPYSIHNIIPFIRNDSDYDLFFEQLCLSNIDTGGINAINGNFKCETLGLIPAHSNPIYLSERTYGIFKGKSIYNSNYIDDRLVTTVKNDGILYNTAWFASKLDVRVSKSSVATIGGGTTYLSPSANIGNISDIANNGVLDSDKNKNFVGAGIASSDISSYSKKINDSTSLSAISGEGDSYESNIDQVSNVVGGTIFADVSNLSDFDNYNGIENVFILKNTNFVINNDIFAGITDSRTYIIENGDLRINTDIIYNSDNVAFIVKGGDIGIHKNVNRIDGTYVTIVKDGNGGSFNGIGGDTINKLLVNGSLYGNIDNLISSRTYVKQNGDGQIDVGTIVSFGSYLFRKPAPLLSTFINEYLTSEKIAK